VTAASLEIDLELIPGGIGGLAQRRVHFARTRGETARAAADHDARRECVPPACRTRLEFEELGRGGEARDVQHGGSLHLRSIRTGRLPRIAEQTSHSIRPHLRVVVVAREHDRRHRTGPDAVDGANGELIVRRRPPDDGIELATDLVLDQSGAAHVTGGPLADLNDRAPLGLVAENAVERRNRKDARPRNPQRIRGSLESFAGQESKLLLDVLQHHDERGFIPRIATEDCLHLGQIVMHGLAPACRLRGPGACHLDRAPPPTKGSLYNTDSIARAPTNGPLRRNPCPRKRSERVRVDQRADRECDPGSVPVSSGARSAVLWSFSSIAL